MIDGGIFLGRDPTTETGLTQAALMRQLGAMGCAAALAGSLKALWYDDQGGNRETLATCKKSGGRLLPMAILNLTGFDPGVGGLERLQADGFVALGLFPKAQPWGWGDAIVRSVLAEAARIRLPVQAGITSTEELGQLLRATEGLPDSPIMIRWMRGSGYNLTADMVAAGKARPGWLFDVGTTTQCGGIEWLVDRLGADRLFLASNMPLSLEGAAWFTLWGARLSDDERARIGGGSLLDALDMSAASQLVDPEGWTTWQARPKVDTHWHTGRWNIVEPRTGFEAMSEDFDRFGYRRVISSSILALNYDLVAGNEETARFIDMDDRVHGLIVVNPHQPDLTMAQIDEWAGHERFVGLKTIQDYFQDRRDRRPMGLDNPAYQPILQAAKERGLPVMGHLPGMAAAARAYPEVTFVAGHATWNFAELATLPNVYFDIATSTALRHEADIGALIAAAGIDRVIFSCDGPLMTPAWTMGKLAGFGLAEDDLDRVLCHNAFGAFPRLTPLAAGGA